MGDRGEQRKNQILDVAKVVFSQKGYYEAYVEDIIRQAGVGKGTFYRYFKNKEDLFISLLLRFLEEWEQVAFVDPSELGSGSVDEYFRLLIRRSFSFFEQNEELCNIYLRIGPGLNEIFEPYMKRFEDKMLGYIITYLEEARRLGYVRDDLNISLAANMIAGAFLRVDYYYFVLNRGASPVDLDGLTADFFGIIRHGIILSGGLP